MHAKSCFIEHNYEHDIVVCAKFRSNLGKNWGELTSRGL